VCATLRTPCVRCTCTHARLRLPARDVVAGAQLPPPGRAPSARGRRCASCTRRVRAHTETACASLCWATARRSGTRCFRRVSPACARAVACGAPHAWLR
jgi:hypothetical protein